MHFCFPVASHHGQSSADIVCQIGCLSVGFKMAEGFQSTVKALKSLLIPFSIIKDISQVNMSTIHVDMGIPLLCHLQRTLQIILRPFIIIILAIEHSQIVVDYG